MLPHFNLPSTLLNRAAQINELLCKMIAYNITVLIQEMHELGIEAEFNIQNHK